MIHTDITEVLLELEEFVLHKMLKLGGFFFLQMNKWNRKNIEGFYEGLEMGQEIYSTLQK